MTTQTGAELIAAERQRQIEAEQWDEAHDDHHTDAELIGAGIAYAISAGRVPGRGTWAHGADSPSPEDYWPWDDFEFKPSDPIRDLVKAGALFAAEIDRRLRAAQIAPADG